MLVSILGCGPAGLIAAHAAVEAGHQINIFSKRRKSELYGAQYLHAPIPGIVVPSVEIKYTLVGDADAYRSKVYGDRWEGSVSPEDLLGDHRGWDIRAAYGQLWDRYWTAIRETDLGGQGKTETITSLIEASDLVINSIPRNILCVSNEHDFISESIWAIGDAPERGTFSPLRMENNTVVCNGTKEHAWYRASTVFNYSSVEWPVDKKPPMAVANVVKPLRTNCTCWPDVKRVGRYGKWEKGVLSHEAWDDTMRYVHVPVQGALF